MGIWFSYSAYKQYKNCPSDYNLSRVKKQEPPVADSRHNALVGTVVQKVFEDFYNDELWRRGAKTSEELLNRAEVYHNNFVDTEYIDWDDFSCRFDGPSDALDEILEIVPKVLLGIKREGFLGPFAKSEQEYKVRFGQEDFLLGYVDFVIKKQDGEVWLLDGKASRHRDKYVDPTQLLFYALLFYLRYRVLPDRLGFFYYRFADDPEQAMDWIDVDKHKIKALKDDIEDVLYDIKKRRFDATPSPSVCKWCNYNTVCSARLDQKAANRRKRKANSKKSEIKVDFGGKATANIGFGNLKGQ